MAGKSRRIKDPVAVEYGQRLESARRRAGLTQKQAAALAGITVSTYRSYEKGRSLLPVYLVPVFARAFHTTLEALHGVPGEPPALSPEAQQLAQRFEETSDPRLRQFGAECIRKAHELDRLRQSLEHAAPPAKAEA